MTGKIDKQNRIAPESVKTRRAREKLKKQWDLQDSLITQSALDDTVDKMHKWIAANASGRIRLKDKDIRLFDQNQNAAALSHKVQQFAKRIYEDFCAVEKLN